MSIYRMSTHWTLHLIHFLYVAFTTIAELVQRRRRRQPKPLEVQRSKTPNHICLNLVAHNDMPSEEVEVAFLQCLQSVAAWCRVAGIEILSVYDRYGVLCGCSESAHQRIFETSEDCYESEVEYPLTPPLSESSDSRSHSPDHTLFLNLNTITLKHLLLPRKCRNVAVRRKPKSESSAYGRLTVHIASRASGKPAIVSAARSLLQNYAGGASGLESTTAGKFQYNLAVSKLAMVLEAGIPSPDLMIIHHINSMKIPYPPIEFYGVPPWQNTLTEFHRTHTDDNSTDPSCSKLLSTPILISETAFCRALDEYAGAEFRLGR